MEFRVLGPVELVIEGRTVPIRSSLQRTLLALLLAEANRVISLDRIIDALWGYDGWETGHQRLWFHVSKLRGRLDNSDASIERSGFGYRLRVVDHLVDAHRFARLIDGAGQQLDTSPADASALARQALTLWRGTPYEDIHDDAVGRAERARLEELHVRGVELWIEAELRLGRTETVIPELEKLIVDHPYREGFSAQLMRALQTERRHTEVLALFATTRALFDDELGIEPSVTLYDLAARSAASRTPPPVTTPAAEPARRRGTERTASSDARPSWRA